MKPILFQTEMIRAILQGRKTMTRRIVNKDGWVDQYEKATIVRDAEVCVAEDDPEKTRMLKGLCAEFDHGEWTLKCKYDVGDVLWVRETILAFGKWQKNGMTKTGKQKYKFINATHANQLSYYYGNEWPKELNPLGLGTKENKEEGALRWWKRPSIFMPKEASRIFLEITDIKVERLQDISEQDAENEGAEAVECGPVYCCKCGFTNIWEKINGEESWNENPWVWVISFKRIDKPVNP